MAFIKFNGVDIAAPDSYSVAIQDINGGESQRSASGLMIKDIVAVKRKIELNWTAISDSDTQKILQLASNNFFNVTYTDPQEGVVTKTFYSGDRTTTGITFKEGKIYWGLKFNIIER